MSTFSIIVDHFNNSNYNRFIQLYFDRNIDEILLWSDQFTEQIVWDNIDFINLPKLTQDLSFAIATLDILPEIYDT